MDKNLTEIEDILKGIFKCMSDEEIGFSNEAQLQYELAIRLKEYSNVVDKVELEVLSSDLTYNSFNQKTKNDKKYYTDIVIKKKDGNYVAIELKFKTPEYPKKQKIMKHKTNKGNIFYTYSQGAEDEGSYLFWKDVERLENFSKTYLNFDEKKKVDEKFAIIMTNSEKYWKDNINSLCSNFFLVDNNNFKNELCWKIKVDSNGNRVSGKTSKANYSNIIDVKYANCKNYSQYIDINGKIKTKDVIPVRLKNQYTCKWNDYLELEDGSKFRYLILEVK